MKASIFQNIKTWLWLVASAMFLFVPQAQAGKQAPHSEMQVQLSYAPVVKQTAPAVVNVFTKRRQQLGASPLLQDPLLKFFLEQSLGLRALPQEKISRSLGSGVIIRAGGLVVTNYHVIEGSSEIQVVLNDGREFAANMVAADKQTDLALLQIQTSAQNNFPFIPMSNSDDAEIGDIVLAIGNPFGIGQTVTSGIVSALARTAVGVSDYQFFIQTDASINPGNSGGALVDMDGKLLGIPTAIYSRSGGSNGIGFATPVNVLRAIVESIDREGRIVRPWLGATVQDVNADIANALGLPKPSGVLINKLAKNSPADQAGMQVGDVVLAVDGFEVADAQSLRYRVATAMADKPIQLLIMRGGERMNLSVTLSRSLLRR